MGALFRQPLELYEECAGLCYCVMFFEIITAVYRAAETQAAASGRALPASMAGAAAAAPGPKAGEGPVTRALLKIGPGSSLEVGIGNYPALTAALKQCVMFQLPPWPVWLFKVRQDFFRATASPEKVLAWSP